MRRAPLLLLLALTSACRTAGPPPVVVAPPQQLPPAPPPPVREPRVALVLGGGAARGFAHIGVIRVLEQERIPIDMVIGTSVGSLIGAIYAAEKDSFDLEWTAFQLQQDDLFDFRLLNAVTGMGYARGERLEAFVRAKVKEDAIEKLKVPFAAVATDLNWGQRVVMDRGSVARAVRASSAIPGVFEPVTHMGKLLVDGGVVDNIPIDVAREKGAEVVIAVDISEDVGNTEIKNLLDVLLQATNIMFAENVAHRKQGADVLVQPNVKGVGMLDFTQK
ncbi:MAG TPA: patatin-like phospholipase family protein, partial [Gemmatimonadales bacterium]|nr:patatin-like phospholipase family protein [Gemmatimonadales bacterium]